MSRSVIITGDDFGLAVPVNEAIEIAHQRGVLTTTCLLIGSPAAQDAIERARRNPGLRVGLHIAVCEGTPVLAPTEIPDLVDKDGALRGPVWSAINFFLRPRIKDQLRREIRAQFQAFYATGLRLDHVNGHNNMQLHPIVLPIVLSLAREFGVRAIRVPLEPLIASWRAANFSGALANHTYRRPRCPFWLRTLEWLAMRFWASCVKWHCQRAGFQTSDYVFGIYDCGGMDLDLFMGALSNLPPGLSEIHCHPATRRCPEIDGPMPDYQHESELAALTNPLLRDAFAALQIESQHGYSDSTGALCDANPCNTSPTAARSQRIGSSRAAL